MENNGKISTFPLKASTNGSKPPIYESPSPRGREDDDINLRQIWFILKHRLPIIFLVTALITAMVAGWTLQKTPIYEGKFQLLVGEPIAEDNSNEQSVLAGLKAIKVDYATQIEVLRSSKILKPILAKFAQKYPDLDYKNLVTGKKAPLQIKQLEETKILDVSYRHENRQQIRDVLKSLAQSYLQYSLLERKTEINQGIAFVSEQLPKLRERVNSRQAQLQQFRQKYNLLDPEQKARELSELLNTLEEKYLDTQVKLNETISLYGILQQQIGLDPQQAIAASFLSESPRYQNLLNQLQEIEIELAKESARFLEGSPAIETLQEKQANLLPLLQEEAQNVLGERFSAAIGDSPSLASPSALRLTLNQQFVQASNELQVLQVRRAALEKEVLSIKQQIQQMPTLARRYTDLQRELTVATDSLNRFLEAEAKLQIDAAQQSFSWQLISPPTLEKRPLSPKPVRDIALGAIAGLLLGVGAAFWRERFDPVYHSLEELKQSTQLPLLGVIPLQKNIGALSKALDRNWQLLTVGGNERNLKSPRPSNRSGYSGSGFLEAFRSLNTNIWLLGSDQPLHSLVISSAAPKDGKSTVAIHLAQAAAAMGQRVLLVDADLRRPQVHQVLDLENQRGLSNVLAAGIDPSVAIQTVERWENLSVLTAGDIPPDPTRLLATRHMKQFIESLQQSRVYDLVIYDTPPLLNFADARILGALVTGIILVVKLNQSDRSSLQHIIDELSVSQVSLLGLVANGSDRGSYSATHYYDYYRRR